MRLDSPAPHWNFTVFISVPPNQYRCFTRQSQVCRGI